MHSAKLWVLLHNHHMGTSPEENFCSLAISFLGCVDDGLSISDNKEYPLFYLVFIVQEAPSLSELNKNLVRKI